MQLQPAAERAPDASLALCVAPFPNGEKPILILFTHWFAVGSLTLRVFKLNNFSSSPFPLF